MWCVCTCGVSACVVCVHVWCECMGGVCACVVCARDREMKGTGWVSGDEL